MLPDPARSLSPRCLFRKMVSIYPRSPPELPTWPGTQLVNKGLSKPGLGGWVEGRGGEWVTSCHTLLGNLPDCFVNMHALFYCDTDIFSQEQFM